MYNRVSDNLKNKFTLLKESNLSAINSYLLAFYGMFISLSNSVASLLSVLILLIFLFEGDFKNKFSKVKHNSFIYAIVAFVLLHFIGLLWTEDFLWAFKTISREWKLLFIILLMMVAKKEDIFKYLKFFLLGMGISEVVSYAIWFKLIPPFMHATAYNPTPFMKHLSYNIYLAVAISILVYFLILHKETQYKQKFIMFIFIFIITMTVNMFITGGRSGQVAFLAMIIIMALFLFKKNIKIAFILLIGLFVSFIFAFNMSTIFHNRTTLAINTVSNFDANLNTSVGIRIALAINSWELIKKNPLLGVGTGDLLREYEKVNASSQYKTPVMHPHNMYLLVLSEFGLVGFSVFLWMFYTQLKVAFTINDDLKSFRFAFIGMFLIIMLSNSYLYTHHTMVLYMFFSSFLYQLDDPTAQN